MKWKAKLGGVSSSWIPELWGEGCSSLIDAFWESRAQPADTGVIPDPPGEHKCRWCYRFFSGSVTGGKHAKSCHEPKCDRKITRHRDLAVKAYKRLRKQHAQQQLEQVTIGPDAL